jgi:hypothetical protein
MKVTIQSLRQAGFKVRVLHTRNKQSTQHLGFGSRNILSGKGGATKIEITTPDTETTVAGVAKCSDKDSFNRKLGNEIALGRALAKLNKPILLCNHC